MKVTLELRDEFNNFMRTIKKNVPVKIALKYVSEHEIVWFNSIPCSVVINWN